MNPRRPNQKPAKPINKRKRNDDDRPWKEPKQKRARKNDDNPPDVLALRTDNRMEFTDNDTGLTVPLKTAVIVAWDKIDTGLENPHQYFSPNLDKIKSHRPIDSIAVNSPSGKPRIVLSPGKTRLSRTLDFGLITFFSNIPKEKLQKAELDQENFDHEFYKSPEFKQFVKINNTIKKQEKLITQELLEATRQESISNSGKRPTSQNKQMVKEGVNEKKGGASTYTSIVFSLDEEIKNIRWEWLHLIAYAILGSKSQNNKNLVCGTYDSNTAMMLIESQVKKLSEYYPQGFTLRVKAELVADTHVAKKIDYSFITPDFTLPFNIDGQLTQKPHRVFGEYIGLKIDSLLKAAIESRNQLKR